MEQLPDLRQMLCQENDPVLKEMADRIDPISDIHALLCESIRDNPPMNMKDGNIIRTGYDTRLDDIRLAATDGKTWIASLQQQERERTGISSLKVKFNKVFGYFIDVTKTHLDKVPDMNVLPTPPFPATAIFNIFT